MAMELNYIFGLENKIIIIGFKGSGSVFENIFDEFRNSLTTLKINQPPDIKEIVNNASRSYLFINLDLELNRKMLLITQPSNSLVLKIQISQSILDL
jgi:hypothetical protein